MSTSEMNEAAKATVNLLRAHEGKLAFVDLACHVIAETKVDEASVKAAILRLSSEGLLQIAPDASVRFGFDAQRSKAA
jgi:hypothetical protein